MNREEYILKTYTQVHAEKYIKICLKEFLDEEYRYGDEYWMTHYFLDLAKAKIRPYAEKIANELKSQKGRQIVCLGGFDYSWMGSYSSFNKSRNRVAQWFSVKEIVSNACLEYWSYTAAPWKDLKFIRCDLAAAQDLLKIELGKNTVAVGLRRAFLDKFKLK